MRLTPGRPPKPIQQRAPKGAADEAMMFLSPIETKVASTVIIPNPDGSFTFSRGGKDLRVLRKKALEHFPELGKKATAVDDGGYA